VRRMLSGADIRVCRVLLASTRFVSTLFRGAAMLDSREGFRVCTELEATLPLNTK
jgi:hypothetical protein